MRGAVEAALEVLLELLKVPSLRTSKFAKMLPPVRQSLLSFEVPLRLASKVTKMPPLLGETC